MRLSRREALASIAALPLVAMGVAPAVKVGSAITSGYIGTMPTGSAMLCITTGIITFMDGQKWKPIGTVDGRIYQGLRIA